MADERVGQVDDIFSSLQGEGCFVGERHLFVRLAGCPWRCDYCDTPESLTDEGHPALTVDQVTARLKELLAERPHKTVSITGGEPLMQAEFLTALLPAIQNLGLRTSLETSATHPHLFKKVTAWVDVVAADIKLPSSVGRAFWVEHDEFLRLAGDRAFAKIVVTDHTTDEELETAVNLLSQLTPPPTLVLQPVTPIATLGQRQQTAPAPARIAPPPPERLVAWWDWARQRLPVVKLIPQMHPIWGLP
jgi:organic radical activating enzyme